MYIQNIVKISQIRSKAGTKPVLLFEIKFVHLPTLNQATAGRPRDGIHQATLGDPLEGVTPPGGRESGMVKQPTSGSLVSARAGGLNYLLTNND